MAFWRLDTHGVFPHTLKLHAKETRLGIYPHMASKKKKKSVATKTVSKKSPKPAPKAAVKSSGQASSKKLPVRSGKSAAKPTKAAAAKPRLAPPPVPSAKEALGKKNPDYMLQIISHARDRGGKIARDELNDLLPAEIVSPDEIERVEEKLRGLGIEIVRDAVEIETAAPAEKAAAPSRWTPRGGKSRPC